MVTPGVLVVALALAGPSLWRALAERSLPVDTALVHFLLAVVVAAAGRAVLSSIVTSYARTTAQQQARVGADPAPRRRRTDTQSDRSDGGEGRETIESR